MLLHVEPFMFRGLPSSTVTLVWIAPARDCVLLATFCSIHLLVLRELQATPSVVTTPHPNPLTIARHATLDPGPSPLRRLTSEEDLAFTILLIDVMIFTACVEGGRGALFLKLAGSTP